MLLGEPVCDLINCYESCAGSVRNRCGIGHVVKMAVRYQDRINLDFCGFDGCRGRFVQKWIEQDFVVFSGDQPSAVAVPGYRDSHGCVNPL